MDLTYDLVANVLAKYGWTILGVLAGMTSLIHFRNDHLSQIARKCVNEWLYDAKNAPDHVKERKESLLRQIEQFTIRYKRTCMAFNLLFVAIFLLLFAVVTCSFGVGPNSSSGQLKPNTHTEMVGCVVAAFAVLPTLMALYLGYKEFKDGIITLQCNNGIVEGYDAEKIKMASIL